VSCRAWDSDGWTGTSLDTTRQDTARVARPVQ
jgi:hypothetical protein